MCSIGYGCFYSCVGFEVLTSVVMKNYIFRDITPCSPLTVYWRSLEHVASIFWVEKWILAVHSVRRASQRKLNWCIPFPSCFLLNRKCRQADCSCGISCVCRDNHVLRWCIDIYCSRAVYTDELEELKLAGDNMIHPTHPTSPLYITDTKNISIAIYSYITLSPT
jgi:hypothetical protein